MVHARKARVVCFPQSARAVVREAEWMVSNERVANELKPLVKLAREQGWRVNGNEGRNSSKLVWRGPNGEGPVYTGYRVQSPNDLANYRTQLRRAGLRLDADQEDKAQVDEVAIRVKETADEMTFEEALEKLRELALVIYQKSTVEGKGSEWKALAESYEEDMKAAQKTLEQHKQMIEDQRDTLAQIREAFKLQPWAILGKIAEIMGLDPEGNPKL